MHQINSETEYRAAFQRLEELFDAKMGTEEGEELMVLASSIESYEDQYFPIAALLAEEEMLAKDF